jgi:ADP-dependent NAD(P)H-hydrate dehydratase / NAD(P)H-hydrate epimerase
MHKLPTTLYTAAQVRELDRIVITNCGIPGIELMSRAGNAVFRHLRIKWPDAQTLNIFCGSGNNAGDGYIIAGLALAVGLNVTVYAVGDPENLKDNALIAYKDFIKAKGNVVPFQVNCKLKADIVIDALLGTGLNKPVTGEYECAIQAINNNQGITIAVDVPSGLNADTGSIMGCAVKANCTVTFIGLKQGLYTGMAADYCGEIVYSSLSIPKEITRAVATTTHLVTKKSFPLRARCSHKGNNGHVLVIGGDRGYSGAARMAGEAALRVGAGLVSIATHPEHSSTLNFGRPELMCHGIESMESLTPLFDKANVVVIGPGLGQSRWAVELFIAAIKSDKPLIIDADGLHLLTHTPERRSNWILTPHPGEAARLLGSNNADIQQDRYAAAAAIQIKYNGIAILKGTGTLIAGNDGIAVSTTGNPGMASGGMGDVLAGVIGGLIAQGFSHKDAAQQGVYLHGMAADLAVEQTGERGLLAADLMPYLRQLVN